jgi:hypothetical protein
MTCQGDLTWGQRSWCRIYHRLAPDLRKLHALPRVRQRANVAQHAGTAICEMSEITRAQRPLSLQSAV